MKKRKILSLFLSFCLILGLLPTAVLAADQTDDGAGIRIQYVADSYEQSTGIMKVRVQAKLPAGTGISSIGTLLSYDNTKLSLVSQADTSYDYTPADGSDVDTLDDAMKTIMATKTKTGPNRAGNYEVTDGKVYTKDTRTALYTHHANTKSLQYVANDAQTGGNWFDVYEVMFRVAGKPADPAAVLDSGSLRIADVAKGDDAVMKGAHPANNIYSIYLTDNSNPAKLYVLNRMSGCVETEVTGEKSLMTAPETGTATYPGSTNSPAATTYTVTVQNDGNGTASASPATAAAGTEITLSATANSGYHFKEWQVVSGTVTIAGNKFNMPSSNVTVKAIFEADAPTTYTVTFNANGGTASAVSMQTGADGKLTSLPNASRSSYTFAGWYTAISGGTQITTAHVFYGNTTVYAHWTYTGGGGGGGGSYTPSYTVSVDKTENGTITVSPKSASKGDTVTITVKPDKGYELEMLKALDKDGDALKLTEKNGKYTFKMPSGKVTVKGSFVEEAPVQIFKDVPTDAYYYEAVKWAAEKGITGGVGNGLFAPNQPCTRAQIVTFLWRAAGSPAPKNMSSFTDVPADAFYAKAVAWAVENGITGGTGDGKFSPDATCTRAQSVTFLYRAAGSPKVSGSAEFGDVATDAYYADAVAWAAKNGITGGIGGGLFGSGNNCTRAQIVTFIYRSVK